MALAMPKSMTLTTGWSSMTRDEDVRGLDVAVNNAFLMSVLDCLADRQKKSQPLVRAASLCWSQ